MVQVPKYYANKKIRQNDELERIRCTIADYRLTFDLMTMNTQNSQLSNSQLMLMIMLHGS